MRGGEFQTSHHVLLERARVFAFFFSIKCFICLQRSYFTSLLNSLPTEIELHQLAAINLR